MARASIKDRDLEAELAAARRDAEQARTVADRVVNEESEHLDSDDTYAGFLRRKAMAAREATRLDQLVTSLETELENDQARRELAAFERKYEASKARNLALRDRVVAARETIVPQLLTLLADLAQDAIDVESINRIAPPGYALYPADATVRDRPSAPETVLRDEMVALWCDDRGNVLLSQESVAVGADGAGSISADFGRRRIPCSQRKFRRIEKLTWRPASTSIPLWKSMVLPRFDRLDAPLFDGTKVFSAQQALQVLSAERCEHPRNSVVELRPLDVNGNEIVKRPVFEAGPA